LLSIEIPLQSISITINQDQSLQEISDDVLLLFNSWCSGSSFVAQQSNCFFYELSRILYVFIFFLGLFFIFLLGKKLLPEPTSLTNYC